MATPTGQENGKDARAERTSSAYALPRLDPQREITPEPRQAIADKRLSRRLLGVISHLGGDRDLPVVLDLILATGCDLAGAQGGELGIVDSDGRLVEFRTHGAAPHRPEHIGDLPRPDGILRRLIHAQEPTRAAGVSAPNGPPQPGRADTTPGPTTRP
ncbi:MAG: hypothetical protein ACRDT1_11560, partial [Micromonosporaceae bacterium]